MKSFGETEKNPTIFLSHMKMILLLDDFLYHLLTILYIPTEIFLAILRESPLDYQIASSILFFGLCGVKDASFSK